MDTSARLLRLLALLQSRPSWSGPDLAERCGVTDRTLRRDMNRLRDLGYAITGDSGRFGGYRLEAGGSLPPLLLDEDEAVAVALALRAAADGGLAGMEDDAVLALSKIEKVLPSRIKTRISEVTEATVGMPARPSNPVMVGTLVTIARACRGPERLRFTYTDGQGRVTERHVEPYRLVHLSRRWYLVARDRDRDAWRSFRVDRVDRPVATGMRFEHTDAPDPLAFVTEGMAVGAYRYQAEVDLHVDIEEAARMVPPTVGVLRTEGTTTRLTIGADDLGWLARFLAGLPCSFDIRRPPELRAELRALAEDLLGRAGS